MHEGGLDFHDGPGRRQDLWSIVFLADAQRHGLPLALVLPGLLQAGGRLAPRFSAGLGSSRQ